MNPKVNVFALWKESQLLMSKCCKVTETGAVLWNEGLIIDSLEILGYRSVVIGEKVKFLSFWKDTIEESSYKDIKDMILDRMNCMESQKERMYLIRNNIFFSEDLLKNLKEAIPDQVNDNSLEFYIGESVFIVTPDKTFMQYCA